MSLLHFRATGGSLAHQCCHQPRGGVHPGWVSSPSGGLTETNKMHIHIIGEPQLFPWLRTLTESWTALEYLKIFYDEKSRQLNILLCTLLSMMDYLDHYYYYHQPLFIQVI